MDSNTNSQGGSATTETKQFLTSKTMLGLIVMLLGWLNARFHWGIVADEQAAQDVMTVIGGALTAWGRITATKGLHVSTGGWLFPVILAWAWFVGTCVIAVMFLTSCTAVPGITGTYTRGGDSITLGERSVELKHTDGKQTVDLVLPLPVKSGTAK